MAKTKDRAVKGYGTITAGYEMDGDVWRKEVVIVVFEISFPTGVRAHPRTWYIHRGRISRIPLLTGYWLQPYDSQLRRELKHGCRRIEEQLVTRT